MKKLLITITLFISFMGLVFSEEKETIIGDYCIYYNNECSTTYVEEHWKNLGRIAYYDLKSQYQVVDEHLVNPYDNFSYKDLIIPILEKYGRAVLVNTKTDICIYWQYAGEQYKIYIIYAGVR